MSDPNNSTFSPTNTSTPIKSSGSSESTLSESTKYYTPPTSPQKNWKCQSQSQETVRRQNSPSLGRHMMSTASCHQSKSSENPFELFWKCPIPLKEVVRRNQHLGHVDLQVMVPAAFNTIICQIVAKLPTKSATIKGWCPQTNWEKGSKSFKKKGSSKKS